MKFGLKYSKEGNQTESVVFVQQKTKKFNWDEVSKENEKAKLFVAIKRRMCDNNKLFSEVF